MCDDAEDILAFEMRLKAIEVIKQLIETDPENRDFCLMKADLMRRANRFSEVIKEFEIERFDDDLLNRIIEFQIEKARLSDNQCYTVEDVVKAP